MTASDVFPTAAGGLSHAYGLSTLTDRKTSEKGTSSLLASSVAEPSLGASRGEPTHTILMRKLPFGASEDALRSMLLFAKDLIDVSYVSAKYPEDQGFSSAVAHFKTLAGAQEARDRLNGKTNATNEAHMVVELLQEPTPGTIGLRRNTVDGGSNRTGSTANGHTNRQSSRYNGTFQSLEKMSPPNGTPGLSNGEFPIPESGAPLQSLFSPTSPVGNSFPHRNLGKTVITDGDGDDDSDGLLKESIGLVTGGQASHPAPVRRPTNPSLPGRFSALSLNTNNATNGISPPAIPNYASPRSGAPIQSPTPSMAMSSHGMPGGMTPNPTFQQFNQHYPRPNYPPVNPADQNPPCNTLYVGNLPIDTSEDELKAMFSKQRGYKRLCFRTKQNGPMCFVEFEDVSFATKALNELYGYPLHNSVKGGIRLSFSKNPLGVRTGQSSNMSSATPITPQSGLSALSNSHSASGFTTATGPPPGLSAPPGLAGGMSMNSSSNFGVYSNGAFGSIGVNDISSPIRSQPFSAGIATSVASNGYGGNLGGGYSNYMMGR